MANTTRVDKRIESNKLYLDSLQEQYSKLNVIRVDLAYTNLHSDDMTLERANKDLNRLLSNRRSKPSIFEHIG